MAEATNVAAASPELPQLLQVVRRDKMCGKPGAAKQRQQQQQHDQVPIRIYYCALFLFLLHFARTHRQLSLVCALAPALSHSAALFLSGVSSSNNNKTVKARTVTAAAAAAERSA